MSDKEVANSSTFARQSANFAVAFDFVITNLTEDLERVCIALQVGRFVRACAISKRYALATGSTPCARTRRSGALNVGTVYASVRGQSAEVGVPERGGTHRLEAHGRLHHPPNAHRVRQRSSGGDGERQQPSRGSSFCIVLYILLRSTPKLGSKAY